MNNLLALQVREIGIKEEAEMYKRRSVTVSKHNQFYITMASKRKRTSTARFESGSVSAFPPRPTSAVPSTTQNRTVIYSRSSTGRQAEHVDTTDVSISTHDLAILQQHPEYNLPTESLLDFETSVHDDLEGTNDNAGEDDNVPSHKLTEHPKARVDPNLKWLPLRETYLDELLRHDGRQQRVCSSCGTADARYKCVDCFGPLVFCCECLIREHASHPFHRIEVRAISYP